LYTKLYSAFRFRSSSR